MIAVIEDKQQILLEEEETPKTPNLTWTNHSISAPKGARLWFLGAISTVEARRLQVLSSRKELQEALAIH